MRGCGSADRATVALAIAILASGQGTTLQALIDACAGAQVPASIVGVFSDRPNAPALERARAAGLAATGLDPAGFADRAGFDQALFDLVAASGPRLIVLAGFMRIIDADTVRGLYPRMINLHPSLLPKYPGLRTHARALAAGDREHGASVHMVTPELDAGPVLAQVRVPVLPDDGAESLEARVRERERPLLVACVAAIAQGRLRLTAHGPEFDRAALTQPLMLTENDTLEPTP